MKKIDIHIKESNDSVIFHDCRKDIRLLGKITNLLIEKLNESIEEINILKKTVEELKTIKP